MVIAIIDLEETISITFITTIIIEFCQISTNLRVLVITKN